MSFTLLSSGKLNTKLSKNSLDSFLVYSLNLKPAAIDIDGKIYDLCAYRTKGCTKACVGNGGHFSMQNGSARKAQIRRTEMYFKDRKNFFLSLKSDIEKAIKQAERKGKKIGENVTPVFRLNAYSDINMHKESKRFLGQSIFDIFPECQFYDYTKDRRKCLKNNVTNYSLTYSHNEDANISNTLELVRKGTNVAVVFEKLPETFHGIAVIDGDKDDKRFLDPKGVIVGLKFKGSKKDLLKAISDGFCIPSV